MPDSRSAQNSNSAVQDKTSQEQKNTLQIGIVGLGRMGANIARRLMRDGHRCVVYDKNLAAVGELATEGATAADSLAGLVKGLTVATDSNIKATVNEASAHHQQPRIVWVMLPAGQITEDAVTELGTLLSVDDIIIDGGNSFYKDDIRRATALKSAGIQYIDVGTSGGVWGLERGYCLMIGGDRAAVDLLDPIFKTLAPGLGSIPRTTTRTSDDARAEHGYIHTGPAGSGHFVKMVHNGIEYGLMQAYAEGFDILRNKSSELLPEEERFDLNLADISEVWRRGSVISSWLLDLSANALANSPELSQFSGFVEDSGEGRWTIQAAIEEAVPVEVLTAALYARFRSRLEHTFGEKLLSAMRFGFGGHVEQKHSFEPVSQPQLQE